MTKVRERNVDNMSIALAALDYAEYGPLRNSALLPRTRSRIQSRCEGCGLSIEINDEIVKSTREPVQFNREIWVHRECIGRSFEVHPKWLRHFRQLAAGNDAPWLLLYTFGGQPGNRKQCLVCRCYTSQLAVIRRFKPGLPYVKYVAACCVKEKGAIPDVVVA